MRINLIKTERLLSPTQISIAEYTINPYRGCPFGCLYCYAQENKTIKKRNQPWGSFIDVKENAVELLKKELAGKNINRVLLGSTVECYPPQEEKFKLTHNIIKTLNENNIAVTILTKSKFIKRDLDLLSKFKDNKIYLTINFESDSLRSIFEPYSTPIQERIEILKLTNELNINNRIHTAPVIPYIQNIEKICEIVRSYAQEISVELYNFKMGNWRILKKIIENNFGERKITEIEEIFSSKENYQRYVKQLEEKIHKLQKQYNKKIILLAPNFDDYYRSDAIYE